jgi:hypothetical protein
MGITLNKADFHLLPIRGPTARPEQYPLKPPLYVPMSTDTFKKKKRDISYKEKKE